MKITKRQLRRIIAEEKQKLTTEALSPGTPEYQGAVDDLYDSFRNAIARARDAGLLQDDVDDAYQEAVEYIRMTIR